MIFKVPALTEEIGDPLDIYSVNHDIQVYRLYTYISPSQHFVERGKEDKTLVAGGEYCELDLERCELVGGHIMR